MAKSKCRTKVDAAKLLVVSAASYVLCKECSDESLALHRYSSDLGNLATGEWKPEGDISLGLVARIQQQASYDCLISWQLR